MITTSLQVGKKAFLGAVVAGLFAFAFIQNASAMTYYYPPVYYPQTHTSTEIQALLQQVYALVAKLQALQGGYVYVDKDIYDEDDFDFEDYDIEVETEDVDVDGDDEATFTGDIELDDAPYADVWFAYGQDGELDEESDDVRVDDDGEFDIDVDDLDEDEKYYVRAVAEDPSGSRVYGDILAFTVGDDDDSDDNDDDDDNDNPEVTTEDAENVDEDEAELQGEVDMNDFEDGLVFLVYGEDEDAVEDVEDEDMFGDIDEDGDDLQKIEVDSSLDGSSTYEATIGGLNDDTDYFYRFCVEYEDEDDDETLECGDVESFTTDED